MFCLFSRSYSFQWKALYRKLTSHNNSPMQHGHIPILEPQIHEHTMPIITRTSPDTSISLRYFFIVFRLIFYSTPPPFGGAWEAFLEGLGEALFLTPYSSYPYRWLLARRSAVQPSYRPQILLLQQVSLLPRTAPCRRSRIVG